MIIVKDTVKAFIPSTGNYIEVSEEEAIELKRKFDSQQILIWIIYIRGD